MHLSFLLDGITLISLVSDVNFRVFGGYLKSRGNVEVRAAEEGETRDSSLFRAQGVRRNHSGSLRKSGH